MTDIIGKLIAIIIAFILIVIFPFTVMTIDSDMKVRMRVENEVQRAIDEIIDSRQYSKSQIEDLNLSLAGLGPTFDVEVERYVRTIDPDPDQPGKTYISYVKSKSLETLWDNIYEIPNYDINREMFWAGGKIFALREQKTPIAMIDTDMIVWSDISTKHRLSL